MTKQSTLLYWVDEFDETSDPINYPVNFEENFNDYFLNTVFKSLEVDPGDELVEKVLLKSIF